MTFLPLLQKKKVPNYVLQYKRTGRKYFPYYNELTFSGKSNRLYHRLMKHFYHNNKKGKFIHTNISTTTSPN